MADIKCPHCGGPYCDLEKKEDTFEKTICYYYCNGCKQHFHTVYKKPAPSGTWLLTFRTSRASSPRGEIEFYRNPNSSIYYRRRVEYYNEIYDSWGSPEFSTHYTSPFIYTSFGGLDFWFRDNKDSSSFVLKEIQMSPELAAKALQDQAMRTIYLNNNSFSLTGISNTTLQDDVCLWLRSTLNARDFPHSKGGCYIATAIYGTYDCPQVWTLRRFRDDTLASTWCGRTFIRIYYSVSPALVKQFGHTRWFRQLWRRGLDRLIKILHMKGIKDTPYQDKLW